MNLKDPQVKFHDAFDNQIQVESNAFNLIPLIYTGGANSEPGLLIQENYHFGDSKNPGSMFSGSNYSVFITIGTPRGKRKRPPASRPPPPAASP